MALNPGTRLGGYEILALLGSGGMGEVYRARDTRLARDVAIKVLPAGGASPERLQRFVQEARAAAALNHPNILAVYDVIDHDGVPCVVSELLQGETVRAQMTGLMPRRKALSYALQIAQALAAAHDKGIVHGGLSPESIYVTHDGVVKLLDFGVGHLREASRPVDLGAGLPLSSGSISNTGARMVAGPVDYLSPEQLRGTGGDHRSDLFSFGSVVYELLTGRRAFGGGSPLAVAHAILTEAPAPFAAGAMPPAIERTIQQCLEKLPSNRPRSAQEVAALIAHEMSADLDLAARPAHRRRRRRRRGLSLASLVASDTESTAQKPPPTAALGSAAERKKGHGSRRHRIRGLSPAAVVVIAAAALLGGIGVDRLLAGPGFGVPPPPLLRRLTFDQGIVRAARFAGDGGVVVYSAAWNGGPLRLYTTRPSALRSTPLGLPDANLLSVSPTGQLAISLGATFDNGVGVGTLGRALLSGSEARPMLPNVREADWMRDGETLAVVRHVDGRDQLEWPAGKVLYRSSGHLSSPRVSPDGTRLAFGDHPSYDPEAGSIQIIDRTGARSTLVSNLTRFRGLAWSKPGTEVWFSAATDDPQSLATLQAVSLSGGRRTLLSGAVDLALMDVDRSGRVLISGDTTIDHIESDSPYVKEPAVVGSLVGAVSDTAERMLLTQRGTGTTYLLTPADGTSTRVGEGVKADISRDGRWTLTIAPVEPSRISIVSIATGELRELSNSSELKVVIARFFPDGEHVVIVGSRPGESLRGYIQDVKAGLLTPFTKAGIEPLPSQNVVISSDGQRVALTDTDGRVRLFSIDGGNPQTIPGLGDGEYPVGWTADGTAILVTRGTQPPWQVDRLDLSTAQREPWKVIAASQPVGLASSRLVLSPTGATYVHNYSQRFSSLFLVDGLR